MLRPVILLLAFWQPEAHPIALRALARHHHRPLACIGSVVGLCLVQEQLLLQHPPEPPANDDDEESSFCRRNVTTATVIEEEGPSDDISRLFLSLCFPPYASSTQNVVFQFLRAVAPPKSRMGAFVAYIRRSARAQGKAGERRVPRREHTNNKTFFIPNAFFHHGDILHF